MTWAEFQIRLYSYRRQQERLDLRAREIAWTSLIGSHSNPKKLPKTKQKFWQIGDNTIKQTSAMQDAIKKAQEQYLKAKQNKNG